MNKLQSMEDLLNRKSLFVRDIDPAIQKFDVKMDLAPVCPKDVGLVCVPVDPVTQGALGYAYLNFRTSHDAKDALKVHRFKLKIGGKPVGLAYSVSSKDRQKILGPWGYRLSIIVKNLSSEVTDSMLCNKFETYGEIFRCKVGTADFGGVYGLVQYIEERSVIKAVNQAHKTAWLSSVIEVERHEKMGQSYQPRAQHPLPRAGPEVSSSEYDRQAAVSPAPSYISLVSQGSQICQDSNLRHTRDEADDENPEKPSPHFDTNDSNGSTGSHSEQSPPYSFEGQQGPARQHVPQSSLLRPSPQSHEYYVSAPKPEVVAADGNEDQRFCEQDPVEEAIHNGVGVMSFMAGRRNRMCEAESSRKAAASQRNTTNVVPVQRASVATKTSSEKMSLRSALDILSSHSSAITKVVGHFEKLTGGQMGEGYLCCPISQVHCRIEFVLALGRLTVPSDSW
eukprot:evm.model.scf_32EXC.7 EVM.evm.TU.scf_32EXC.7   scf_32EXC:159240-163506(-)